MNNWTVSKHFIGPSLFVRGGITCLLLLFCIQRDVVGTGTHKTALLTSDHGRQHQEQIEPSVDGQSSVVAGRVQGYESLASVVTAFQRKHPKDVKSRWKLVATATKANAFARRTRARLHNRYVQNIVKLSDYYIPKMVSGLVKRDPKTGALHSEDQVLSTMLRFMDAFLLKRQRAHYDAIRELTLPDCGCVVGISLNKAEVFDKVKLFTNS